MKKNDYLLVQAFMIQELGLKGNELIIYALIHGFSKDGESEFKGSLSYISEWTGLSRPTVVSILKQLQENGLISKREYSVNGVKMCAYSVCDEESEQEKVEEVNNSQSLPAVGVSSVLFPDIDADIQAQKAEEKRKSDELFEQCWIAYRRKGSKKKAKEYWLKIEEKQKQYVLPHINAYVSSRELAYQKDFERYLRDCTFTTIVYCGNNVIYDPTKLEGGEAAQKYLPKSDIGFGWNDYYKCYMFSGFYTGFIPDGYSDDERPDGASVKLGNAQGTVIWSSEKKEWVLHREMV